MIADSRWPIAFMAAFIAACGDGAPSAPPSTFSISGSVTGDVLQSVMLGLDGPITATTQTDAQGQFRFDSVGPGTYLLTPSRPGYAFAPPSRTVTVNVSDVIAGAFSASDTLPAPVSTIRFDSGGVARATASGPMNWCVKSGPLVELWFGALDPMFITFSTFIILPYAAPGGNLIVPRQWTVGVSQVAGDSAYAFIGLSAPTPGNPTAIVSYSSYAGSVRLDSLRADSVLFMHGTYDVRTADQAAIPVGTVTVDGQAFHSGFCP